MTRRLLKLKERVEKQEKLDARDREIAGRFLVVRETPKRGHKVTFDEDELGAFQKKYAGFFCIAPPTPRVRHLPSSFKICN